jgi:hypothetical protein
MGLFHTSGKLVKSELRQAVRAHFETLERVIQGTYAPALERHNVFLKGTRAERLALTQYVYFGRIGQEDVETISDELTDWINGRTVSYFHSRSSAVVFILIERTTGPAARSGMPRV